MTAEETALEEFREAVWRCRHARMWRDKARASGNYVHVEKEEARMWREQHFVRALARIIRAIRAEREDREAMYAAYKTGRRDALREAIDLCRRTEAGDTNHDWREAAKCCRELIESLAAKAAEEAAIRARRRVREVMEANGTNPERFVSEWCRAQAEYEVELEEENERLRDLSRCNLECEGEKR